MSMSNDAIAIDHCVLEVTRVTCVPISDILLSKSHENPSKYVDTVTHFIVPFFSHSGDNKQHCFNKRFHLVNVNN